MLKLHSYFGHKLLEHALAPVAAELSTLDSELRRLVPYQTEIAERIASHIFSSPGKKIRPALFLLVCRMLGYNGEHRIKIAGVCELVHTASLLHDDVVDNSSTRRCRPTTNSIWGDASAILFGDLLYSRASELMAETASFGIVSEFAKSIRRMSESELLQTENVYNFRIKRSTYNTIIFGKTASLIGTCCKSAGFLAKAKESELAALGAFGEKLGTAFQLLDDALDFDSATAVFGKKRLADLQEGRITLPLILLREQASKEDYLLVEKFYESQGVCRSDLVVIAELVDRYQTCAQTLSAAKKLTEEAVTQLTQSFPPSLERDDLVRLASSLATRVR